MGTITKGQIRMIHVLKNAIGMKDPVYRGALYVAFGVRSSKDLTVEQAASVMRNFQQRAGQNGLSQDKRFDFSRREGFATKEQLLYINGLWKKVSRGPEGKGRDIALRNFILRVAKVSDLRFLTVGAAAKVINALKNMQGRKTERAIREEAAGFAIHLSDGGDEWPADQGKQKSQLSGNILPGERSGAFGKIIPFGLKGTG